MYYIFLKEERQRKIIHFILCSFYVIHQFKLQRAGVRAKRHISDIKNGHVLKATVCEDTADKPITSGLVNPIFTLRKIYTYISRTIWEAIQIQKHSNFNREDGWKLSTTGQTDATSVYS